MLFDHRGLPIPLTDPKADRRTNAQKQFDQDLRQQMSDPDPRSPMGRLALKVKQQMVVRDVVTAEAQARQAKMVERTQLDELADQVQEEARHKERNPHSA